MPSVAMSWVAPEKAITPIMATVKGKKSGSGSRKAITRSRIPTAPGWLQQSFASSIYLKQRAPYEFKSIREGEQRGPEGYLGFVYTEMVKHYHRHKVQGDEGEAHGEIHAGHPPARGTLVFHQ